VGGNVREDGRAEKKGSEKGGESGARGKIENALKLPKM